MSSIELRGKLLRWGNSFGLRLSRRDVERLHLRPGAEVHVTIPLPDASPDVDLPSFHLGADAADRHDDLFAASVMEDDA